MFLRSPPKSTAYAQILISDLLLDELRKNKKEGLEEQNLKILIGIKEKLKGAKAESVFGTPFNPFFFFFSL